jgi:hypothetical protein
MIDPGAAPVTIPCMFTPKLLHSRPHSLDVVAKVVLQCLSGPNSDRVTCGRVRRYLQRMQVANHPHLWVKSHDNQRQPRTRSGVFWEWLPTDKDIQELERIEFVDYRPCTYIIALKFTDQGAEQEMEETPEPLGLFMFTLCSFRRLISSVRNTGFRKAVLCFRMWKSAGAFGRGLADTHCDRG